MTLKQASCGQFPAVATAIGVEVREGVVGVEGDLDFRGTLGVSKEVPVGFQRIRLYFDLETDASEEQLTTLNRLTERYFVVYQILRQSPTIDVYRLQTSLPLPGPTALLTERPAGPAASTAPSVVRSFLNDLF